MISANTTFVLDTKLSGQTLSDAIYLSERYSTRCLSTSHIPVTPVILYAILIIYSYRLHFIQIKDSIVNSWSSVSVRTLDEMSQVSAVVSAASEKKDEVSMPSQVGDLWIQ